VTALQVALVVAALVLLAVWLWLENNTTGRHK
jgi:hypothetical protein